MPAVQDDFSDNKPFLSISGGKLRRKVEEGTPGAVARINKNNEQVYELVYPGWSGTVHDWEVASNDFGDQLRVTFDDAVLTMNVESAYFRDFVRKFASADKHRAVTVKPYDFVTDEGKRMTGLNIFQGENKLDDYFSKKTESGWVAMHGFPEEEDWDIKKVLIKKFYIAYVGLNPLNTIGDQPKQELEAKEMEAKEINLDDVPY